jgi:Domain of unknown function (DUF4157)
VGSLLSPTRRKEPQKQTPKARVEAHAGVEQTPVRSSIARYLPAGAAPVGRPDDPAEREADRRSEGVLAASALGTQSTARLGAGTTAAERLGNLGRGGPLSDSTRGFFEPRFGVDLGSVRVHEDAPARSAARSLGARAFSYDGHIVLRGDRGRHDGVGNRSVLAHELAHVVLGHSGVRRQVGESQSGNVCVDPASQAEPADPVCRADRPENLRSSVSDPVQTDHPSGYDPCKVDVGQLTNYGLLAEYWSALAVVTQGRSTPGYFDYRNLQRRLIDERDRRVDLGHAWLASMPRAIPETVYRIVDNPDGTFTVLAAGGIEVSGVPTPARNAPYMTSDQFDNFLATHAVQRVSADTYRLQRLEEFLAGGYAGTALATGGLYNSILDYRLMDPFAMSPLTSTGGMSNKWQGRIGEASFMSEPRSGFGLATDPLNNRSWIDRSGRTQSPASENYPAFDFQRTGTTRGSTILGISRVSVKAPLSALPADRYGTYREGLQTMLQSGRSQALQSYIANQPEYAGQPTFGAGYEANRSTVLADSMIAINADDVGPFRLLLSDPTQRESAQSSQTLWEDTGGAPPGGRPRPGWRQVFAGEMRENPVRIGNQTYSSPDALDAARDSHAITPQQHAEAQRQVGRRAAARTVSTGITTGEIQGLRTSRTSLGSVTDAQLMPVLTPEYMRGARLGQGTATGAAGLQGAGGGAFIAVLTTGGMMLFDEAKHPHWEKELAVSGGLGALGGGTGAAAEQVIISGGSSIAMRSLAATGSTALTRTTLQGAGRFGGGAVGAMFVEAVSMGLLEEREHSGAEVAVRLGRSAVLGGSSVWAGAAVGTAVGGPIGFIVGLAVGGLLYYLGDKVVPGGREDWDAYEAGCRPHVEREPRELRAWCFAGSTPITMSDLTTRVIAELVPGDMVMSYHEPTGQLQPNLVLKVHRADPRPMLVLNWADDGSAKVTSSHKFLTPTGWTPAGDLRPGDQLLRIDPNRPDVLVPVAVESIRDSIPDGSVYDLEIDEAHTYFAAGVLVHNKVF